MTITLNLTPVLITAIICVTLCVICKNSKGEKKEEKVELLELKGREPECIREVQKYTGRKIDQHSLDYMEELARREGMKK